MSERNNDGTHTSSDNINIDGGSVCVCVQANI